MLAERGKSDDAEQEQQCGEQSPGACRPFLVMENFFENQFFLFEKMATDLDSYLRRSPRSQTTGDTQSRLIEKARLAVGVLRGVSLLHEHGMVHLDLGALGIDPSRGYRVSDLLHAQSYDWFGGDNYVSLNPDGTAMHIFKVEQPPA